jgi:RNA binding exosome subunit
MESINLENNLKLSFEKLPHTIRLIVSKDNEELVCRKEKLRNLLAFTELNKAEVFKGRLQLCKSDDKIAIQFKNENISTISAESFEQALNNLK